MSNIINEILVVSANSIALSLLFLFILVVYLQSRLPQIHLNFIISYFIKRKLKSKRESDLVFPLKYEPVLKEDNPRKMKQCKISYYSNYEKISKNVNIKVDQKTLFIIDEKTIIDIPLHKELKLSIRRKKKKNIGKSLTSKIFDWFTLKMDDGNDSIESNDENTTNEISMEQIVYEKYKSQHLKTIDEKIEYFKTLSIEELSCIKRFKRRKFKRGNAIILKNLKCPELSDLIILHFTNNYELEQKYYELKREIKGIKHQQIVSSHFQSLLKRMNDLAPVNNIQEKHLFYGLNFILHRIFFQYFDSKRLSVKMIEKFQAKKQTSTLPSMVKDLKLTDFKWGPNLPIFHKPVVTHSEITGKTRVNVDFSYNDGIQMLMEAVLQLPFKNNVTHVKATLQMRSIKSNMKFFFNQNPSEKIWFGFDSDAEMNISSDVKFSGKDEKEKKDEKDEKGESENTISKLFAHYIKKEMIYSLFVIPSMQAMSVPTKKKSVKKHPVPSLEKVENSLEQYQRIRKLIKTIKPKDEKKEKEKEKESKADKKEDNMNGN